MYGECLANAIPAFAGELADDRAVAAARAYPFDRCTGRNDRLPEPETVQRAGTVGIERDPGPDRRPSRLSLDDLAGDAASSQRCGKAEAADSAADDEH